MSKWIGKWIDVDDRLPEILGYSGHSKVVLCIDSLDRVGFGIYMDGSKQLQREGWFTGGGVGEDSRKITHWMPIPKRESEDTENDMD